MNPRSQSVLYYITSTNARALQREKSLYVFNYVQNTSIVHENCACKKIACVAMDIIKIMRVCVTQ